MGGDIQPATIRGKTVFQESTARAAREASRLKNSQTPVWKSAKKIPFGVRSESYLRLTPCKTVVSEDIFKSTPVHDLHLIAMLLNIH